MSDLTISPTLRSPLEAHLLFQVMDWSRSALAVVDSPKYADSSSRAGALSIVEDAVLRLTAARDLIAGTVSPEEALAAIRASQSS